MADMQLAVTATDVMLYTAIPATEVEKLVGDTLRAIEAYDLTLTNTSLLIHEYLARALPQPGRRGRCTRVVGSRYTLGSRPDHGRRPLHT